MGSLLKPFQEQPYGSSVDETSLFNSFLRSVLNDAIETLMYKFDTPFLDDRICTYNIYNGMNMDLHFYSRKRTMKEKEKSDSAPVIFD